MKTKNIRRMENYTEIEADFEGYIQTFRLWKDNTVEIKFNDNFARANGFIDVEDMLNQNKGMRETLIMCCGEIPTWINVGYDGIFKVKITQVNELFN